MQKLKQAKKIFTRMLMNNWGGVSHKIMEFHEYVNLFSGKSGSGKSTVMDAIQVVLYGSISATFLNKAADDAKNRRSVLSYLRGAQKDGSYNRDGQDFCSQIVLEIFDTGTKVSTCIGVAFEVGKNDTDIRKYTFFSHSGKIPEDEYLTEKGVPYTIAGLRKLVEKRVESSDNRGRGDVNRLYPSKEAYLKTVYDVIFGYVEPGRMMTMEKSAIALRMTNGTGQFIRDYMFPKSKEDTVSTISDQLGAYREIKERVEDLENRIHLLDEISRQNLALQRIDEIKSGNVSKEAIEKLKKQLSDALESINEEVDEIGTRISQNRKDLKEKKEMVEDLKNDRKPYRKELKQARQELQNRLSTQYGRTIHVNIFADLFDITDEKWKNAIEGRMGRVKHSLVTAPEYALDAAKVFRKLQYLGGIDEVDLLDTAAIVKSEPKVHDNSIYEAVHAEEPYVDQCLRRYLGRIAKCETEEELRASGNGVTADCYSYNNYIFRHLKKNDYEKYACIGTKVSKAKLREMEDEVLKLSEEVLQDQQMQQSLKAAQGFERLNQSTDQILHLAGAGEELQAFYEKQDQLEKELRELREGSRTAELNQQKTELEVKIREIEKISEQLQKEILGYAKTQGQAEQDIVNFQNRMDFLMQGFVLNEELQTEVQEALKIQSEQTYRRKKSKESEELMKQEEEVRDLLTRARNQFNQAYPSYGLTGVEHENVSYDRILNQCRQDFEPKYKDEFQKQYDLIYHTLRENVIATIHGEIKAAYRHRKEINRMLAKIKFSDSIYQIDILPAENENGQFYEMLMAPELDSKVLDDDGFDGQITLGEDTFYQKYEQQILRLTEKFMPPKDEDAKSLSQHRQQMEQYVDYRNYLTFSMYERVEDEDGNVKKNAVDDMAGRDSGGEGQNPKYVALLAGFAMLYMQQTNRDSKIRLVLLDEAFSKMDKERSEVCLHYARELELQLIVCVPDERLQSLIRNVDSVYGFRRYQNQVSMMHIDKGEYLDMIEGKI